jgi:hypothetical protein
MSMYVRTSAPLSSQFPDNRENSKGKQWKEQAEKAAVSASKKVGHYKQYLPYAGAGLLGYALANPIANLPTPSNLLEDLVFKGPQLTGRNMMDNLARGIVRLSSTRLRDAMAQAAARDFMTNLGAKIYDKGTKGGILTLLAFVVIGHTRINKIFETATNGAQKL